MAKPGIQSEKLQQLRQAWFDFHDSPQDPIVQKIFRTGWLHHLNMDNTVGIIIELMEEGHLRNCPISQRHEGCEEAYRETCAHVHWIFNNVPIRILRVPTILGLAGHIFRVVINMEDEEIPEVPEGTSDAEQFFQLKKMGHEGN